MDAKKWGTSFVALACRNCQWGNKLRSAGFQAPVISVSRREKPAAGICHIRLRTQAAFHHAPNGERFHHPVTFSQIKSNDSPEFEKRQNLLPHQRGDGSFAKTNVTGQLPLGLPVTRGPPVRSGPL
jgi:hypothetical protein